MAYTEIQTKKKDEILKDMLNDISDDYQKTEGNITYDIPSSAAIEMEKLYDNQALMFGMIDIDNLKGDDLTRFVKQRKGIIRKPSTFASGTLNIVGTGTIDKDEIFETETGLQFRTLETKAITESGFINIECTIDGSQGNVGANSIVFIPVTIPGIISVVNSNSITSGFDEESDESLRERYKEQLITPATSGNKYHYLNWAKEKTGVGNAKVFSLWNGANTVKVLIIDSNMLPASEELVNEVQSYIDPNKNGKGEGQAPIGAYCTVESAIAKSINISVDVTEIDGFTLEKVKENIQMNIVKYLKEIAFHQDYVSHAKIGSIIFNTEGVKDYTTLTVNGATSNIEIQEEEVAVLGTITIT